MIWGVSTHYFWSAIHRVTGVKNAKCVCKYTMGPTGPYGAGNIHWGNRHSSESYVRTYWRVYWDVHGT